MSDDPTPRRDSLWWLVAFVVADVLFGLWWFVLRS
jgi:hypothetical protein